LALRDLFAGVRMVLRQEGPAEGPAEGA
jgi:hypothetical protein